jgi:hypothetical protein
MRLKEAYGSGKQIDSPCWTLNKRIAHLTKARGDGFDYGKLDADLYPLVVEMLRAVALAAKRPLLLKYAWQGPER